MDLYWPLVKSQHATWSNSSYIHGSALRPARKFRCVYADPMIQNGCTSLSYMISLLRPLIEGPSTYEQFGQSNKVKVQLLCGIAHWLASIPNIQSENVNNIQFFPHTLNTQRRSIWCYVRHYNIVPRSSPLLCFAFFSQLEVVFFISKSEHAVRKYHTLRGFL